MKTMLKITTRYTAVVLVLLTFFGCNKFGDLNTDPTKSSNLDPVNQLMFAQLWFSGDLNTQERTSYFLLIPMMQQLNGAYNTRYGALYIKEEPFFWGL